MAEWLGSALQKLLQRFESASDLHLQEAPSECLGLFVPTKIPSTPAIKRCDIIMTCRLFRRSNFVP